MMLDAVSTPAGLQKRESRKAKLYTIDIGHPFLQGASSVGHYAKDMHTFVYIRNSTVW